MKIWLIGIGEPLPIDQPGGERLQRSWLLTREFLNRGHEVTWWTSTFDHSAKRHRFTSNHEIQLAPSCRLILIRGRGYRRNICLGRLIDHRQLGRCWGEMVVRESPPDLVFAGLPPLELPWTAYRYAASRSIPFFVDISDVWPDTFLTLLPPNLRKFGKRLFKSYFRMARESCAGAAGVLSISRDYLGWGLGMAGRERRASDGVYPLGYAPLDLETDERARLRGKWVELGVDPRRFVCCFFGTFSPLRDLQTVIEAARELETSGDRGFQFILCGDGDSLKKSRKAAMGLTSVFFPGWVDARDIAAIMSLSKAGLVPYTRRATQSLPNKPFEYFSAGLPVISSLEGELAELIADHRCGVQYEPGNMPELLSSLRQLRDHEADRQTMGESAKALFEERFTVRAIYPALAQHIEESMARWKHHRSYE